jgi:hypothetical protein
LDRAVLQCSHQLARGVAYAEPTTDDEEPVTIALATGSAPEVGPSVSSERFDVRGRSS